MASLCIQCGEKLLPDKSQCRNCGKWNILPDKVESKIVSLDDADLFVNESRLETGPWDPCFGGGIEVSSVTLFAGQPGAGKSTLILQIANEVARTKRNVLLVASEETAEQIAMRGRRLKLDSLKLIFVANAMGGIDLRSAIERVEPQLIILDSLPGFTGSGITNRQESLHVVQLLKKHAEMFACPAIVTDHINKEDDFAGYMALKHAVDTLLRLDVGNPEQWRNLRVEKNRHGPVPVTVKFRMGENGLTHAGTVLPSQ